jgi:hypothetical protein
VVPGYIGHSWQFGFLYRDIGSRPVILGHFF